MDVGVIGVAHACVCVCVCVRARARARVRVCVCHLSIYSHEDVGAIGVARHLEPLAIIHVMRIIGVVLEQISLGQPLRQHYGRQ